MLKIKVVQNQFPTKKSVGVFIYHLPEWSCAASKIAMFEISTVGLNATRNTDYVKIALN